MVTLRKNGPSYGEQNCTAKKEIRKRGQKEGRKEGAKKKAGREGVGKFS